ncbi:MAG: hypothetical protein ABW200_16510 [Hyphomicrobiaceae bacterium]|jgi:hypothetical protein
MRAIIVGLLSVGLVSISADTSDAGRKKKHRHYDSYSVRYPYATPRQIKNARAYENGGYYETDSNAHPIGSHGWWEMKRLEGNDRRRF